MSASPQASADAANDAYKDRPQSDVDDFTKRIPLNGQNFTIFGYKDDPSTGFHATAYLNTKTHEIIIGIRGTDPDILHHTRTTVQDALVDVTMVKDKVNPQEAAAHAFTQEMIDKAQRQGIPRDHVTLAGHSLGGALVEIEAFKLNLHGATFNGYGAVDLGYSVPPGGNQVTNYVMAGDVVSAGSRHFGEVKVLASQADVDRLHTGRYLGALPGAPPPNPLMAMRLDDHSVTHFTGKDGQLNVLAPANLAQYEARYAQNKIAFDHFRGDVQQDRAELATAMNHAGSRNIETTLANMSPHLRQQLAEYHASLVDAPIQHAVEHSVLAQGMRSRMSAMADNTRSAGQAVQSMDERMAAGARQFSHYMANPLPGAAWAAERVADAAHLHGQATHAMSEFAAGQWQSAKHRAEQGAHLAGQVSTQVVHAAEVAVVRVVDTVSDTYKGAPPIDETLGGRRAPTPAVVLSPPLDPPSMRDFRHAEHPLNDRYQMFRDALGEQGFHQDRPTLKAAPEVRRYSAEQKDRLAAGFTAQVGADTRFSREIQHFGKDRDTLYAVEHPVELGTRPLVLAISQAQTLARTPAEHAAGWRARELPEPQAVNTARPDPHSLSPDHPGHPAHPRHAMFEHAREALSAEYARWGMQKGAEPLDRETMQVVIAARAQRMNDVGAIRLGKGNPDHYIGEYPMLGVYPTARVDDAPGRDPAFVESKTLQNAPPVQQAVHQFQAVDQQATQQVQQVQQMQQASAQAQQGPSMGR